MNALFSLAFFRSCTAGSATVLERASGNFDTNAFLCYTTYAKTLNKASRRAWLVQRAGGRWKPGTGANAEWTWESQGERPLAPSPEQFTGEAATRPAISLAGEGVRVPVARAGAATVIRAEDIGQVPPAMAAVPYLH
jgi:hypothetical protein